MTRGSGWFLCVLTALSDGSGGGQVSVLPVHVVGAATGVVTQPDTEVLHLQGGLLMDLNRTNSSRSDFTLLTCCFTCSEVHLQSKQV